MLKPTSEKECFMSYYKRLIYNLVTLLRNAVIEQVVSPHIDDAKIVTELSEPTLNTDQDLLY